jgi:hypothetical protein
MPDAPMNWHHMFGVMVQDFFRGTPCVVELERDLSVKSQFLDVLIVRKTGDILDRVLPDGLEGQLAEHNLITFKSHREALDDWALDELLAHCVNYRKQVSPSFDDLLPKSDFRLFAICARFPEGLAKEVALTEVRPGVYEVAWGVRRIGIIVAGELPRTEANAMLHLFSAARELVQYGKEHCRVWSPETSTLVGRLFGGYRVEGLTMPYTREEVVSEAKEFLRRDAIRVVVQEMPIEERLAGITPEQRLRGLTPADRELLRQLLEQPMSSESGGEQTELSPPK